MHSIFSHIRAIKLTLYLFRSADERGALINTRLTLEGAVKWAFLDFLLELLTPTSDLTKEINCWYFSNKKKGWYLYVRKSKNQFSNFTILSHAAHSIMTMAKISLKNTKHIKDTRMLDDSHQQRIKQGMHRFTLGEHLIINACYYIYIHFKYI